MHMTCVVAIKNEYIHVYTNQRSAVWSYGFSSTSSGDMYSGVPCMHNNTLSWQHRLITNRQLALAESRISVPLHTKEIISEMLYAADLLTRTEKTES